MKKKYNAIKFFIAMLTLATMKLGAQALNGAYTINSGQSTGGTNFANFTAFANALNSNGVSGPVSVNVASNSGPYNEQPSFNAIAGSSATNTITINGNNNLITFASSGSANAWTILMNGADYVYINNLQVQNTGATYAIPLYMTNGSDYDTFTNCTFSCTPNGTSSYMIAVHSSASSTSPLSTGANSCNYCTWIGCQMFGGYYNTMMYGLTTAPFQQGNTFINNLFQDYYVYGLYFYYQVNGLVRGNTAERPTRTTLTTFYGIMIYYNQGTLCENNIVQKTCEQNPGFSATSYCFYFYAPVAGIQNLNMYRNNIVRNIKQVGAIYGIYCYYASGYVYHNTVSLDDPNASSGTVYGIMTYGNSLYGEIHIKNNLVSITRGGTGTRYGIYSSIAYSGFYIEGNDIWLSGSSASNIHAYWAGATMNNLAAWQASGYDLNGCSIDPMFVNLTTDQHPTNVNLNNKGIPLGVYFDHLNFVRNQNTPDVGALEFLSPLCNGTPTSSISGPNYSLCPGENANFGINGLSSDIGITYLWQSSTISNVGPWTNLNSSGLTYTALNMQQQSWYSVVITCTAPGGGSTTSVLQVNLAGPTTGAVPYYENFEGIGLNNRKPNCSWTVPNLAGSAKTFVSAQSGNRLPNSGTSYATFENAAPTNYYYTHPIQMEPGITYSASLWYQTDLTGATNWTDLSIMIGTVQASGGLTTIATTNGPAVSPVYKGLGNTFTVANSGLYYVAVKGSAQASGASYLTWDDLRIEIPCTPSVNTVPLTIAVPSATVCAGQQVVLTAAGANSYFWSTGSTGAALTQSPSTNPTQYTVTGTNTLTGCSATKTQLIFVKQSPQIVASAFPPVSCAGKSIILTAGGAGTYAWNTGGTGANINVSPQANTSYTVIGTNSQNCSASAVVAVVVNANPNVSAQAPQQICVGETAMLTGAGAATYQWSSNTNLITTNPAFVTPAAGSITYTLSGADNNGCVGTAQVNIVVELCTGINTTGALTGLNAYPNPTNGELTIELGSGNISNVQVLDVTGRVLVSEVAGTAKATVSINELAAGVYYVKVTSGGNAEIIKVVKN